MPVESAEDAYEVHMENVAAETERRRFERDARLEAAVPALRQMRGAGINWRAFASDLESLLRESNQNTERSS